jgi:prepilin-type N-terminal cleavage/methylation domain-containing protein
MNAPESAFKIKGKAQSYRDVGFTIIELLVVLTIIGILSGIAYVGLTSARNNSIQDSCKSAYQAIYLGVSGYQTDHGGNMPGSITALEPSYVSASTIESYSKNFTAQLGSFSATSYQVSNMTGTVTFKFGYPPQITVGEKIVVAGIDSNAVDGTWTVKSFSSDPATSTGTVSFGVTFAGTVPASQVPLGGYINAISKTGDPFDIYIFDPTGKRVGTTAPAACSSL